MNDVKMMEQPLNWPHWPVLPLVRWEDRQPTYGFLVAQEGMLNTVHYGSIYDVELVNLAMRGQGKSQSYESKEAIVKDGWKVD